MDISKLIRLFMLIIFASVFVNAAWAEECDPIRFKRGESSATVNGIASSEDVKCYQMATGQGQTATLRVVAGNNIIIFSIDGVVDAQDSYTFTTEKKTYKIRVGQLMRSITDVPFSLFISIE